MFFERQRVLLTLLDALGGQSAPTDFQKLLFPYTREEAEPLLPRQQTPSRSNA
jgi:hypothetical protein